MNEGPASKKQRVDDTESIHSSESVTYSEWIQEFGEDTKERAILTHLFLNQSDDVSMTVDDFQRTYSISHQEWVIEWEKALNILIDKNFIKLDINHNQVRYILTEKGHDIGDMINNKKQKSTLEEEREKVKDWLLSFDHASDGHYDDQVISLSLHDIFGDGNCLHRGFSGGIGIGQQHHGRIKNCAMELFDHNDYSFEEIYNSLHPLGMDVPDWKHWKQQNRKNYHYDEDGTIFFLAYMILFNVIIIVVNEECKIVYPSANEKHTEYILDLVKKGGHEYQIIRLMHLTKVNHYDLLQCNRGMGNLNNFDLHKCLV